MLGVIKVNPVPKLDPPEAFENQLSTPEEAIAFKRTVPEPFLEPGVVLVICGVAKTIAVTDLVFVFPAESVIVTV